MLQNSNPILRILKEQLQKKQQTKKKQCLFLKLKTKSKTTVKKASLAVKLISGDKAVKLISGSQWHDHVTTSCLKLQILKLYDLYSYEVAKLMHKHTRKKLPVNLCTFFAPVKAIHTRSTRLASSELNLYQARYKSQKLQKIFKYQGVKIWILVPQDIKHLPFNRFKIKYKKDLLSKYI